MIGSDVRSREAGGGLRLTGLSDPVRRLLEISGVSAYLGVVDG